MKSQRGLNNNCPNKHNKQKKWRIVVVVVKWRHHANHLIDDKYCSKPGKDRKKWSYSLDNEFFPQEYHHFSVKWKWVDYKHPALLDFSIILFSATSMWNMAHINFLKLSVFLKIQITNYKLFTHVLKDDNY